MKTFLVSILMLFLTISILPQVSSKVTLFNAKESDGLYKVEVALTSDSVDAAFYTVPFTVPKYTVVYNTTPILFHFKLVGNSGVPNNKIILQGIYGSAYVNLDTLRIQAVNQTESDSTGVLTMNTKFAPAYRLLIQNKTADITTGNINLYFPILPRYFR